MSENRTDETRTDEKTEQDDRLGGDETQEEKDGLDEVAKLFACCRVRAALSAVPSAVARELALAKEDLPREAVLERIRLLRFLQWSLVARCWDCPSEIDPGGCLLLPGRDDTLDMVCGLLFVWEDFLAGCGGLPCSERCVWLFDECVRIEAEKEDRRKRQKKEIFLD